MQSGPGFFGPPGTTSSTLLENLSSAGVDFPSSVAFPGESGMVETSQDLPVTVSDGAQSRK